MSKNWYISHPDDLSTAKQELKDLPLPYYLMTVKATPEKIHENEWDKKMRQMSYFHRTVVPSYAEAAGINEDEAKAELQIKFGRCGEIKTSANGEFDVLWVEEDKLRVFEQDKKYYVLSIAGMDNATLAEFIENCKRYLLAQYGIQLRDFSKQYKTKEI